jgi:hypothetical protein
VFRARKFQRYEHHLPALVHLAGADGERTTFRADLRDISIAALCFILTGDPPPALPQGGRCHVEIFRKDRLNLSIDGTLLYTLVVTPHLHHCVILFDRVYPEVTASIDSHERFEISSAARRPI